MIEPIEFTVVHQGLELQAYLWQAEAAQDQLSPKPLLLITHGLGEHALRYQELADYFVAQGYNVAGFDHQGHGKSNGARGRILSGDSLSREIESVLKASLAKLKQAPTHCILWAHSMGGLLALDALRELALAQRFDAAVITGPALKLGFEPSFLLVKMASFAAAIAPNVAKSNELDVNALSRDPAVVQAYKNNPLNHDRVSVRLGKYLLDLPKELLEKPQHLDLPILIMHGEADRICDVEGSRAFAKLNEGSPITFKCWPGLYHEIHHEPEKAEVLTFAKTWLDQHITST